MQIEQIYFAIISFFVFFLISKLSYKLELFDRPNKKKFHKIKIPYTGGVAIVICSIILQKIIDFEIKELSIMLSYSSLLVLLGLLDDKYKLNVGSRLLFQIFVGYIIYDTGLKITTLGSFELIGELNIGEFSLIFTLIVFLLFLNSNNYIDGIDGLCASLFINSMIVFLVFYGSIINKNVFYFGVYLIIIQLIFMIFNFGLFKMPKIFLGNSGSLVLGFFLFCYFVIALNINNQITKLMIFTCTPIIFFEFVSTNLSRLFRSKKIFTGGDDHIHYILVKKYGKNNCLFILNFGNFFLASILIYISNYSSLILLIVLMISFLFYFLIRESLMKDI